MGAELGPETGSAGSSLSGGVGVELELGIGIGVDGGVGVDEDEDEELGGESGGDGEREY